MTEQVFDLFVIGAGSGGVRAARVAAMHGARVGLAERSRFGGTCVIRGCVPKKLMVYASRFPDEFATAANFGWEKAAPHFDWQAFIANKDREIARLEQLYLEGLKKAGVTVFREEARFESEQTLLLSSGEKIRAKYILIATGGRPSRPNFQGGELGIVSDDVFDLKAQPRDLIVVGGGYIGIEFACIFAGLGSKVSVVHRSGQILRGFDGEMTQELAQALKRRNVVIYNDTEIKSLSRHDAGFEARLSNGETLKADQVLLATGRVPNIEKLNLEAAGVKLGARGTIIVNEFSQTNIPHIYAVGDVTDHIALTPVAIREGHAFADSVFGDKKWRTDYETIPSAVFSTPELGSAGLTEEQARQRHGRLKVFEARFRSMKSAMAGSNEKIFMKMIVHPETDALLGAHMLGEGAAEMAQLLAISIRMKARKADLDATMPLHPTLAEEWLTIREPRSFVPPKEPVSETR